MAYLFWVLARICSGFMEFAFMGFAMSLDKIVVDAGYWHLVWFRMFFAPR